MSEEQYEPDFIDQLEQVEAMAWQDYYRAGREIVDFKNHILISDNTAPLLSCVPGLDVLAMNRVFGFTSSTALTQEEVEEIIARYREAGTKRFFIQLNPLLMESETHRLLLANGFTHYNNWVKLYRQAGKIEDVSSDLSVRAIGWEQAASFARVLALSFEWTDDEDHDRWIENLVGRADWHFYLAYDGDKPVATAGFYHTGDFAWVDFAGTLKEYRGRGAQSLLMQRRLNDIIELGCRHVVVETAQQTAERSAPSYRNMIRCGFREAYVRPSFLYQF